MGLSRNRVEIRVQVSFGDYFKTTSIEQLKTFRKLLGEVIKEAEYELAE